MIFDIFPLRKYWNTCIGDSEEDWYWAIREQASAQRRGLICKSFCITMNGHTNGTSNGNLHIANLVQAFEACGYHDNKVRKAGEEALKNFAKDPSYVEQLVSISTYDRTNPQVRHSSIILRRSSAFWVCVYRPLFEKHYMLLESLDCKREEGEQITKHTSETMEHILFIGQVQRTLRCEDDLTMHALETYWFYIVSWFENYVMLFNTCVCSERTCANC